MAAKLKRIHVGGYISAARQLRTSKYVLLFLIFFLGGVMKFNDINNIVRTMFAMKIDKV